MLIGDSLSVKVFEVCKKCAGTTEGRITDEQINSLRVLNMDFGNLPAKEVAKRINSNPSLEGCSRPGGKGKGVGIEGQVFIL